MGDQLAPWLASVIKPILRLFFRTPLTAAAFGMHAATVIDTQKVHRTYFADGNFGTPRDYRSKSIPGGGDQQECERAWSLAESLICRALQVESLPPLCRRAPS